MNDLQNTSSRLNAEYVPHLSTEIFTHDQIADVRKMFSMDQVDIFLARIDEMLAKTGESDRALSLRATGKPDQIRSCRNGHRLPRSENLNKIAAALGVTTDWLLGRDQEAAGVIEATMSEVRIPFRNRALDADLPVLGTAMGHTLHIDDTGISVEQMMVDHSDVLRYITRPPALVGVNDAYAVYIEGDSMYPRYKQGEIAVVDPLGKAQIGDDVIVQLHGDADANGDTRVVCVLIKELVRRSASFIELRQFNPDVVFRVDARKVAHLHPIMPLRSLLGA